MQLKVIRNIDLIRANSPSSPCINMTNILSNTPLPHHTPNIINLLRQSVRIGIATVQVLAAHTNSNDPVRSILLDGRSQRILLGAVVRCVLGPHTYEELGAGVQRGRDGVGESATVGGRVETHRGKVSGDGFEFAEGVLPVGLRAAGAVGVVCTAAKCVSSRIVAGWRERDDRDVHVETLPVRLSTSNSCRNGSSECSESHDGRNMDVMRL